MPFSEVHTPWRGFIVISSKLDKPLLHLCRPESESETIQDFILLCNSTKIKKYFCRNSYIQRRMHLKDLFYPLNKIIVGLPITFWNDINFQVFIHKQKFKPKITKLKIKGMPNQMKYCSLCKTLHRKWLRMKKKVMLNTQKHVVHKCVPNYQLANTWNKTGPFISQIFHRMRPAMKEKK